MAVYKRNIIDIDLEQGNIHRSFLNNSIGMKDQKADHFGVRVFRNGEPVSLTGVSVQGVFMPPQGSPIAITSGNIVSGNVAEVVLPQACYNYDGQFTLAIKLVDSTNSVTGTVRIVDGMVDNTHATGTVAPTSAVPTYQEVLSVYEQAIAVIGKSVRFDTEQSLTSTQKTTARTNIEAASTVELNDVKSAIKKVKNQTAIPANSDLNDYKTPGSYYAGATAAGSITNKPENKGFLLDVEIQGTNANFILQTFRTYDNPCNEYTRYYNYYTSSWGNWVKVQTALDTYPSPRLASYLTINSNTDLNDIRDIGSYFIGTLALSGLQNAPVLLKAILNVQMCGASVNFIRQEYKCYSDFPFPVYIRYYNNGSWTSWAKATGDEEKIIKELQTNNLIEWEYGNIDATSGSEIPATNNQTMRTKTRIKGAFLDKVSCPSGYALAVAIYNPDGTFNKRTSFDLTSYEFYNNYYYYRIVLRKNPDSPLSEYDFTNCTIIKNGKDETVQVGNISFNLPIPIPGTQTYKSNANVTYGYCSWPFGGVLYDPANSLLSVVYSAKPYHEDSKGVQVMKQLDLSTGVWSEPIRISPDDPDYSYYGYASTILPNGDYIVLSTSRMENGTINKSVSDDNGQTWEMEQILVNGNTTTGDAPCSLTKTSSGRYLCFVRGADNVPYVLYSDDNLSTWGKVLLNYTSYGAYEANFIELLNGKICLLMRDGTGADYHPTKMFISSDDGSTWSDASSIPYFDASNCPISIWRDKDDKKIHLHYASRNLRNPSGSTNIHGNVTFYTLALTDDELENMKFPNPDVAWSVECDVGDSGYGTAMPLNNGEIYWFMYMPQYKTKTCRIVYAKGKIGSGRMVSI